MQANKKFQTKESVLFKMDSKDGFIDALTISIVLLFKLCLCEKNLNFSQLHFRKENIHTLLTIKYNKDI